MNTAADSLPFFGHVIDGEEVPSFDGSTMLDIDPYTLSLIHI